MNIDYLEYNFLSPESLHQFYSDELKTYVIISIDSTTKGPAVGGCRFINYESLEHAKKDALNLSKSMTFKASGANINYGGGKSVIYRKNKDIITNTQRDQIIEFFAQCVNSLNGRYITAIDSGTDVFDMEKISKITPYVTGYKNQTEYDINPSYFTAIGVINAINKGYSKLNLSFDESNILVKGVGNVGLFLVDYLTKKNANIFVIEKDAKKAEKYINQYNYKIISNNDIANYQFDLFAPCDIGPSITNDNIDSLNVKLIAGAANNQLESDEIGLKLKQKNILYCPDYIINSGGLISITAIYENPNMTISEIEKLLNNIPDTLEEIFRISDLYNISTKNASDIIALERLKNVKILENYTI